ncbi:MAG TPA: peptidoglycan DD-metalloendopeptidase family protein [Steroidobacteraceae bacterium]|nr:peptidoglycan DD-metalloendopeptidase family protein [Steroidobacteraceae bacterium]
MPQSAGRAAFGRALLMLLLLGAGALALASSAEPRSSAQAKAKLAAVRARIAALTERISADLKERDRESARLRDAELEITAKRAHLESLRAAEAAATRRRNELSAQEAQERRALDAERAALAAQVRAAYLLGPEEQFKLLLNLNAPGEVGRMLTYYGYFARERAARIEEIEGRLARVQDLASQIDVVTARLGELASAAAQEVASLERARSERSAAVTALGEKVSSGHLELEQLKRQEQAIESLIADLDRVLKDYPVDSQLRFDQLRGKLAWPVAGRLKLPRADAHGVLIEGAYGAKVRAPYFGRVVYADWLQGMGMLMIVAHSGNYLTLYGHAEVLYKSVGDWVAPGDVLGALPDTGSEPQLYFEIREGRKPVDPRGWLRATP